MCLSRIDPELAKVKATKQIPTSAKHLTVAPGPTFWAFIEKGWVVALGKQNVESALSLRAPWGSRGVGRTRRVDGLIDDEYRPEVWMRRVGCSLYTAPEALMATVVLEDQVATCMLYDLGDQRVGSQTPQRFDRGPGDGRRFPEPA